MAATLHRAAWGCVAALALAVAGLTLVEPAAPPTCEGREATIVGTPVSDVLEGTDGPDVIHGLGGDDTIAGLGGDDVICGGTGRDAVDPGADELPSTRAH